jgi:hypothetical protein
LGTADPDDVQAEVDTLRDVAILRQRVLSDCLADVRRLNHALGLAATERDAWKSRYERLRAGLAKHDDAQTTP